jgi:hypothetical protein
VAAILEVSHFGASCQIVVLELKVAREWLQRDLCRLLRQQNPILRPKILSYCHYFQLLNMDPHRVWEFEDDS